MFYRALPFALKILVVILSDHVFCSLSASNYPMLRRIQPRVVGGDLTTLEKLGGYIVALLYNGEFTCGGSLVHKQIVVTAQHCFANRREIDHWTVQGGVTLLEQDGQRVQVDSMMKPASFRDEDLHMDVAVLKLSEPLIGRNIKTISLCNSTWHSNDQMIVSGWGLVDPTSTLPHKQLRTATVPIMSHKQCSSIYSRVVTLTKSMFCAGDLGKTDACTYDSGGPLVFRGELCGIVSYGIGCANPKYPGVYTNIRYVRPFIDHAIEMLLKS